MLKLGPKNKGSLWDECEQSEIVQILISHEDDTINSIQFVYFSDGKISHSKMHGDPRGLKFDMVTFDYPSEFLTSVSGEIAENGYLASISFGTNKRKFGPFGRNVHNVTKSSDYRTYSYDFGRKSSFGGFHGSCIHNRVYAIGIYVKPIMSPLELNNQQSLSKTSGMKVTVISY